MLPTNHRPGNCTLKFIFVFCSSKIILFAFWHGFWRNCIVCVDRMSRVKITLEHFNMHFLLVPHPSKWIKSQKSYIHHCLWRNQIQVVLQEIWPPLVSKNPYFHFLNHQGIQDPCNMKLIEIVRESLASLLYHKCSHFQAS